MVNGTSPRQAERALALGYAPQGARAGIAALFALDDTLAAILRTTRERMVGQMRLTWWHEALTRLDRAAPPAHPVLEALAAHVVATVPGATLATMIDGWEMLLEDPLDAAAMEQFARQRGGRLFAAAAALLGSPEATVREAGRAWALADLADHLGDARLRASARAMAEPGLRAAMTSRWPMPLRSLGALVLLARPGEAGSPKRIARLLWHRLTGA